MTYGISGTSFAQATGINCSRGACARITNNHIDGIETLMSCLSRGTCSRSGYGLVIAGGSAAVTGNVILPGHSGTTNGVGFGGYGVQASGSLGFSHNQISGGFDGSAADFESNTLLGTGCPDEYDATFCYGALWSGGGTVADNCINGSGAAFVASSPPATFVNNQLAAKSGTLYSDNGVKYTTAAQVDALTDTTASGTLVGSCTAPPYPL